VVFAGDALATMSLIGRPPGPQLMPFNEDSGQARASLARLEGLPATVVVAGHGRPFAGSPAEAVERALKSS
jgi:glyoxylase-like metal-dependent hydrolase (beta-lactamase superfamily II)